MILQMREVKIKLFIIIINSCWKFERIFEFDFINSFVQFFHQNEDFLHIIEYKGFNITQILGINLWSYLSSPRIFRSQVLLVGVLKSSMPYAWRSAVESWFVLFYALKNEYSWHIVTTSLRLWFNNILLKYLWFVSVFSSVLPLTLQKLINRPNIFTSVV